LLYNYRSEKKRLEMLPLPELSFLLSRIFAEKSRWFVKPVKPKRYLMTSKILASVTRAA
jgi:hypothetical protein